LGLITLTDLKEVPRDQWQTTTVYRAMTPFSNLKTAGPRDELLQVLQDMTTADVNQIPLVDGRLLKGLIHRADVLRYIHMREEIDSGARQR
jgi:CBS domain-containing protein